MCADVKESGLEMVIFFKSKAGAIVSLQQEDGIIGKLFKIYESERQSR